MLQMTLPLRASALFVALIVPLLLIGSALFGESAASDRPRTAAVSDRMPDRSEEKKPLPREWRWQKKTYRFDGMIR